jgi:hypothetical protein
VSMLSDAERAWAKKVYGKRWTRAFVSKRGNGSLIHARLAFRAGWLSCVRKIESAVARKWAKPRKRP